MKNIFSSIKNLFITPLAKDAEPILNLWEDDYMMIEITTRKNLNFINEETKRVHDFGQEHFDGNGYKEITAIKEAPESLMKLRISKEEINAVFSAVGIDQITRVNEQSRGILTGSYVPYGYGTTSFGVIFELAGNVVKKAYFTGSVNEDADKVIAALEQICEVYELIGINWYNGTLYDFNQKEQIKKFINDCF